MKLTRKSYLLFLFFIILNFSLWVQYVKANTVTVYSSVDNGLDKDNSAVVDNSATGYAIGHSASHMFRYIVQFDLPSYIPPGSSINSATFYIYETGGGSSGLTHRCYKLTEAWNTDYACWDDRDNGVSWTNAGGTFSTELGNYSSQVIWGAEASFPATSIVQDWWNTPANNNGLIVKCDNETGSPTKYTSFFSEDVTSYRDLVRPKLVVDYTPSGQTQVTIAKHSICSSLHPGASDKCVGTFKYSADNTSEPRDLTTITLTEYGTCDADAILSNVKLFIDTDGVYTGHDETLLGSSTNFNSSDKADFNFSSTPVTADYAVTHYIHVVLDVSSGAELGKTVGIEINSSSDVTISTESDDITTYPVQLGTVVLTSSTMYYVHSDAPDDSGVPNGDPGVLDNCWKTIGQAFSDLRSNESNDLTDKGDFLIQIQNSTNYVEGVLLENLTTTPNDTLTIRAAPGERPTWKNDTSTVGRYWDLWTYSCLDIDISNVVVEGINFTGTQHRGIFFDVDTTNIIIRNCIFHDMPLSTGVYNGNGHGIWTNFGGADCQHKIYNNVFYNVVYGIKIGNRGPIKIRNNIFCVNDCSIEVEIGLLKWQDFEHNTPDSDYNLFYIAGGNRCAYSWYSPQNYPTLVDWQGCPITPAPDSQSLTADPKFVNPGVDFHLKSIFGHWTDSGWVNDAESSLGIDTGDNVTFPYNDYSNEIEDNGDRVNIGAYGNTNQASLSGALSLLSISLGSFSYDFGTVIKESTNIIVSSITVTNNGGVNERYSLHLAAPAGWTAVTDTAPGVEEFRMCGNFQTATAQSSHFDIGGSFSDAIGTTPRVCSTGDFSKDDEGEGAKVYNVPQGQDRYLWFRFESPTSTALTTQQTITVTITAEEQP